MCGNDLPRGRAGGGGVAVSGPCGAAVALTALPAANGLVTLGAAALFGALAASLGLGLALGED